MFVHLQQIPWWSRHRRRSTNNRDENGTRSRTLFIFEIRGFPPLTPWFLTAPRYSRRIWRYCQDHNGYAFSLDTKGAIMGKRLMILAIGRKTSRNRPYRRPWIVERWNGSPFIIYSWLAIIFFSFPQFHCGTRLINAGRTPSRLKKCAFPCIPSWDLEKCKLLNKMISLGWSFLTLVPSEFSEVFEVLSWFHSLGDYSLRLWLDRHQSTAWECTTWRWYRHVRHIHSFLLKCNPNSEYRSWQEETLIPRHESTQIACDAMLLDHWHKSVSVLWSPWDHMRSTNTGRASTYYELDSRRSPSLFTTTFRCYISVSGPWFEVAIQSLFQTSPALGVFVGATGWWSFIDVCTLSSNCKKDDRMCFIEQGQPGADWVQTWKDLP